MRRAALPLDHRVVFVIAAAFIAVLTPGAPYALFAVALLFVGHLLADLWSTRPDRPQVMEVGARLFGVVGGVVAGMVPIWSGWAWRMQIGGQIDYETELPLRAGVGAFALFFLVAYPLCTLLAMTVPFLRPPRAEGQVRPRRTWVPAVDLAFYGLAATVLAWIEDEPLMPLIVAATAAGCVLLLMRKPPSKIPQS